MRYVYTLILIVLFHLIAADGLFAQFGIGGTTGIALPAIANQNNYGQKEMDYAFSAQALYGMHLGYQMGASDLRMGISLQSVGQRYIDAFNGKGFTKQVSLDYLVMDLGWRLFFGAQEDGRLRSGFYGLAGIQWATLRSADVLHQIDDRDVSFLDFVLDGGDNVHQEVLTTRGNPSDFKSLYKSKDISGLLGLGYAISMGSQMILNLELSATYSIGDINHPDYQLANRDRIYEASKNVKGVFAISWSYYFGVQESGVLK